MTDLKRDDGMLSSEGALALSAFRVGVAAEQRASLAAGVPYPIGEGDGQIVWVHPDGSRRKGMQANAELID